MRIVHLSNDLMLVGRLSAMARGREVAYRAFANSNKLLGSLAPESSQAEQVTSQPSSTRLASDGKEPLLVLVDLQLPGIDFRSFVTELRAHSPQFQVVAYAQHVMTGLLDEARAVADVRVWTRGQFHKATLDQLIQLVTEPS